MNYKPYTLRSDEENTSFHFKSVGKLGTFDKIILIRPLSEEHYNLALLDYDTNTREFSDVSVTDNGDMPEVLATVMKAIYFFWINIRIERSISREVPDLAHDFIKLP